MEIKSVAVVGAGTMGNGIAHVFAQKGFAVALIDVEQAKLDKALATIAGNLDRQVKKGTLSEDEKAATLARISADVTMKRVESADLVIEAVFEDLGVKTALLKTLDSLAPSHAILASNTSSISITKMAAATSRPDRVIGMHFMNPVPVMQLVEVIKGLATSEATSTTVLDVCTALGKTPTLVADYPGFVANRVLMPMINEAVFCLYEGIATREDIDTVMKLGMSHPMGPLQLADFIGLDICLNILNVLYDGFKDPKYRPCPLLVKMVESGYLGRKSGRGFYDYAK